MCTCPGTENPGQCNGLTGLRVSSTISILISTGFIVQALSEVEDFRTNALMDDTNQDGIEYRWISASKCQRSDSNHEKCSGL